MKKNSKKSLFFFATISSIIFLPFFKFTEHELLLRIVSNLKIASQNQSTKNVYSFKVVWVILSNQRSNKITKIVYTLFDTETSESRLKSSHLE